MTRSRLITPELIALAIMIIVVVTADITFLHHYFTKFMKMADEAMKKFDTYFG